MLALQPRWLTAAQAAEYLGTTEDKVRSLPVPRVIGLGDRLTRWDVADLDDFMLSHKCDDVARTSDEERTTKCNSINEKARRIGTPQSRETDEELDALLGQPTAKKQKPSWENSHKTC